MNYQAAINNDPILLANPRIEKYLYKRDCIKYYLKGFDYYFADLSSELVRGQEDEMFSRSLLSYLVNTFWNNSDPKQRHLGVDDVSNFLAKEDRIDELMTGQNFGRFSSCLQASKDAISLLDKKKNLASNISEAMLVTGSVNYGRFFSVRGNDHISPSDLDILIVSENIDQLNTFVQGDAEVNFSYLEECSQFLADRSVDMVCFKGKNVDHYIDISYTVMTKAALEKVCDLTSDQTKIKLLRPESAQMKINSLTDTMGDGYTEIRTEYNLGCGHVLQLDNYTNSDGIIRYSGFANLLLPSQSILLSSKVISQKLRIFNSGVLDIADRNGKASGRESNIFLAHPRKDRFSPLWINRVKNGFSI